MVATVSNGDKHGNMKIYQQKGGWFASVKGRSFAIVALLLVSVCFAFFLQSQSDALTTVPTRMNFQGRLADSTGNIKQNGTYNMRLRLYTAASGGTAVWTEDRLVSAGQGVTLTNGLFALQLGSVTSLPASLFASGPLYLEVELPTPATATSSSPAWTEGAMTPRNQMATSAYAYNSETLDGLDSSDFAAATGGTGYIQNGTNPQTANFNITGNGTIGGALSVSGASTFNGGLTVNDSIVHLNVMGGYQTEGSIRIGRGDNQTLRYHEIKAFNDGTAANNYLTFALHNGTLDSTTDALTLYGNGNASVSGTLTVAGAAVLTAANAVLLQSATPGTAQTGNINISGTVIAGGFSGSGSGLTNLSATNLSSGTVNSARITGSYTGITGTGALAAGSIASGFGTIATGNTIQGSRLISTTATGVAPLTVNSTTKVANLNVDLLDGLDSTAFAAASGSSNYIQNSMTQQSGYFNITGNGVLGGSLSVGGGSIELSTSGLIGDGFSIQSASDLSIYSANGLDISGGLLTVTKGISVTASASNTYGLRVAGVSGQTSPILTVNNSTGGQLFSVGSNGAVVSAAGLQGTTLSISGNATISGTLTGSAIIASNWLRSTGATGWWNMTYDGGWYMADSTWLRTYNSKPTLLSGGFDTSGASGVGCGGGLGGGYTFRVCGSQYTSGTITTDGGLVVGNANFVYGNPNGLSGIYLCKRTSDNIVAYGASCTLSSSIRFKENVQSLGTEKALDILAKLRAVSYDWKESVTQRAANGGRADYGVIAEEIEKILPELVNKDAEGRTLGVNYTGLIPFLITAMQEQQSQIVQLQGGNPSFTSLTVNGPATVQSLTVTGDARVQGDIYVDGHIITGGQALRAQLSSVFEAAGADVVVDGNDTTGTITITLDDQAQLPTGLNLTDGASLIDAQFAKQFGAKPRILISPANVSAGRLGAFTSNESQTGFTLSVGAMPQQGKTYKFTYWVAQ